MSKVLQDYFPRTISQYVPVMEFAADVVDGVHIASLGAPAALDADGILNDKSATNSAQTYTSADWETTFDGSSTSLTSNAGEIDAKFGRCLTAVGTAGSDHVITITGRDYLGQIMSEALTLSGTSTIYGQKAFKYVDTVAVASGAASDTFDLGWSDVLGLPYKAEQLLSWTEDDVQLGVRRNVSLGPASWATNSDASLFAHVAPFDGFITGFSYVATTANTTATSALTVEVGGTAVAGLAITVSASESIGDVTEDRAATWDQGTTGRIASGTGVESVSSAGGTAGVGNVDYYMDENVLFVDGDETTATTTTGDTRGLVRPHTLCDGSVEFEVRYACDTSNLHGIAQA